MPVNVHIPVRVRLDAQVLDDCDENLRDALAAAVRRALDHSHREVLTPRGHYLGVRLHSPEFVWHGDGLEHASARQRHRVETLVREALERTTQQSRVGAHVRERVGAETPLMARAAERFDPRRYSPLGFYTVPTYDGGGEPTTATVEGTDGEPMSVRTSWLWNPQSPDWLSRLSPEAKTELLAQQLAIWSVPYHPGNGHYGLIWHQPQGEYPLGFVVVTPEGRGIDYGAPLFRMRRIVRTDRGARVEIVEGLPQPQLFTAEWWTTEMIRRDFREWIEGQIGQIERPDQIDQVTFTDSIAEFVEHSVTEFMEGFENDALVLRGGGETMFLRMPATAYRWSGTAYLAPIATQSFLFGESESADTDAYGASDVGSSAEARSGGEGSESLAGREGGYIFSGDGGTGGQFSFPRPSSAVSEVLVCRSFGGEPPIEHLPEDIGGELRGLIEDLARRLDIDPCGYAGNFCIAAAAVMGERARTISEYAAENASGMLQPPRHTAVEGELDFTPTASPAVQYLRHLGDVVHRITHLSRRIDATYRVHADLIEGFRHNSHIGWMLDFGAQLHQTLVWAVKDHFISTTRTVFLQLLHTSKLNIEARRSPDNFPAYAQFFEQLVRSELVPEQELQNLRTTLAREVEGVGRRLAGGVLDTWRNLPHSTSEARRALLDVVEGRDPFPVTVVGGGSGEIVRTPGAETRVRDSQGHLWTLAQLDRAIALRHDVAQQIDPLMQQLVSDANLRARFTSRPDRIEEELRALLQEMSDANEAVTQRVREDEHYAFGLAQLDDNYSRDRPQTIPGTGYVLQGVHRVAHETVHEFFRGDLYYNMGVGLAMRVEDTRRWLKAVVEFAVPLVLFVVCAPLGVIAGIAVAAENRAEAAEHMEAYHALIDPNVVFEYAEIEAEMFAADVGLALSFIPLPGMIRSGARVGMRAGTALLRGEVRAAGRIVARRVTRVLTVALVRGLRQNLIVAFVRQYVMIEAMGWAVNQMISPVINEIQRRSFTFEELLALAGEVEQA